MDGESIKKVFAITVLETGREDSFRKFSAAFPDIFPL
jgi:hypothetical protein